MAVQVTEELGDEGPALRDAGAAASLVPAVGTAGALVVLLSGSTREGLRALASSWGGPVLVVGSAEEARAVLGASDRAEPPAPVPSLVLDRDRRVVGDGRTEVELTPLEFGFLEALNAEPGRLCTFEELQQEVWGTPHIGDVTQVHSLVKRLRRKLRRMELAVRLQAVRGVGFRLVRPAPLRGVHA